MKLDKWYMNIFSTIFILQMFFKFDTISKRSKNKNKQTQSTRETKQIIYKGEYISGEQSSHQQK